MRFTIRSLPALLRKTRAWGDYSDSERALGDAIKRLCKKTRAAHRNGTIMVQARKLIVRSATTWPGVEVAVKSLK